MVAKYDHSEHAARLRERAEECRRLAKLMGDQASKASYQKLANAYEILAKEEELIAPISPRKAIST